MNITVIVIVSLYKFTSCGYVEVYSDSSTYFPLSTSFHLLLKSGFDDQSVICEIRFGKSKSSIYSDSSLESIDFCEYKLEGFALILDRLIKSLQPVDVFLF